MRLAIFAALLGTVVATGGVIADVCMESDAERLDEIEALITDEDGTARLDGVALRTQIDLEPVRVEGLSLRGSFEDHGSLHDAIAAALPELAEDVAMVAEGREVREDSAMIVFRSEGESPMRFEMQLARDGQSYRIRSLRRYRDARD